MREEVNMLYTTTPYQHQREALERAFGLPEYALFLEQGTGKSKIVVDEIVNLIERDEINCAIVLAPNQVHENWAEQFLIHGPKDYSKWVIQVYKSKNKAEDQENFTRKIIQSGKVLIFLMNIEALSSEKGQNYLYRLLRARKKSYICVDESHKVKTYSAKRTKCAIALGAYAKFRRIATGTEAQEGLENLYAQFKFLNWNIIGHKGITSFKGMYCRLGGYENRQIVGYQNQEILAARIAPFTYNKRKKECLDLPDKVYVTHYIEMTERQEQIYDEIAERMLYEIDEENIVDASIVLVQILRLHQVLCGHVSGENGQMDIDSNRAPFIAELIEQASGKVIVFCRFVRDTQLVRDEMIKKGIGCIEVNGEMQNRLERIAAWRIDPIFKVLAITTATGGTGLTLNEAATTIFYSNSFSSTDRLQAEDRNHRIGQEQKVTYHDVVVRHRMDHTILRALQMKADLAESFRNLLKERKVKNIRELLYGIGNLR